MRPIRRSTAEAKDKKAANDNVEQASELNGAEEPEASRIATETQAVDAAAHTEAALTPETSEEVESGGAAEPPVATADAAEPLVAAVETSEPPVVAAEAAEPLVATVDAAEPPVAAVEASEPLVAAAEAAELTVAAVDVEAAGAESQLRRTLQQSPLR